MMGAGDFTYPLLRNMREGKARVTPEYDGTYGVIKVADKKEKDQLSLFK